MSSILLQTEKNFQGHVWLLAGTGEGHLMAEALISDGWQVTVSVVSYQASKPFLEMPLLDLLVGPIEGVKGIANIINNSRELMKGFDWVIDATHPFALIISSDLQKACKQMDQSLIRYERPSLDTSQDLLVKNIKAIAKLPLKGKKILLALGSKNISEAFDSVREAGGEAFARILPTPESLVKALAGGLPGSNLAIVRPFQQEPLADLERALCDRWSIDGVICRQSGGLVEKMWGALCKKKKLDLWLISRPKELEGILLFDSLQSLLLHLSLH